MLEASNWKKIATWSDFSFTLLLRNTTYQLSIAQYQKCNEFSGFQQITAWQFKIEAPIYHSENFILSINNYIAKFNICCSCAIWTMKSVSRQFMSMKMWSRGINHLPPLLHIMYTSTTYPKHNSIGKHKFCTSTMFRRSFDLALHLQIYAWHVMRPHIFVHTMRHKFALNVSSRKQNFAMSMC